MTVDNEWDGSVLSNEGEIQVKEAFDINRVTYKRALKVIQEDLEKRGFPMDIVGNLPIYLRANLHIPEGGHYVEGRHIIEMQVKKGDFGHFMNKYGEIDNLPLLQRLYHEIGHAIHNMYFPRWTQGDTNYSTDFASKGYNKSPKEAFANRFANAILSRKKVGDIKSIIREVKKSVDSDSSLNPISKTAYKDKFKEINEKKYAKHWKKDANGAYTKFEWIGTKLRGVKNGKLYTVAENKMPN